ncbi:hypothetical protein EDF24_3726 [Curtobacterium sp. PhB130]|uniref:hypothetical protein n=1 Tax=Curtobacterium sp. PhB130 TaxID=2485178 RepID=UPI000F4C623B|nr:hypothetical protein [Curtobacterium sp. PhB130]ROS71868.1 hypothetical protein EDF24_3726 [Curtobacterium sp. PhB130]
MNERELRKLMQGIARQLEDAGRSFQETHTGLPVHVVRADVADALPKDIELSAETLDEYAAAVAGDEPFEFHLGG